MTIDRERAARVGFDLLASISQGGISMQAERDHIADSDADTAEQQPIKLMAADVVEALRWFEYGHLPADLQAVAKPFHIMAHGLVRSLTTSSPQLLIGLQRLTEAKDCFVRAATP